MRSYALLLAVIFLSTNAEATVNCTNPPGYRVEMCCDSGDVVFVEKDFDDCKFAENMADGKLPPCEVFNCMFNNHDMLTKPDKLNRPKIKEVVMKAYGKEWLSVIEQAMKKCYKELDDKKNPCESKSFMLCWFDYTIHACPKEHWTDSQECSDAKEFDEVCGHRALYT